MNTEIGKLVHINIDKSIVSGIVSGVLAKQWLVEITGIITLGFNLPPEIDVGYIISCDKVKENGTVGEQRIVFLEDEYERENYPLTNGLSYRGVGLNEKMIEYVREY